MTEDSHKTVRPYLLHIIANLRDSVLTCQAACSKALQAPAIISKGTVIAPGENLEKQWRLKATTKRSAHKERGLVFR